ncbi:hypothetical protein K435DRAFT_794425 [Dendrothele bispora CBS 962.96]|uniref:Uncharacterized protein n=1 Tax=Dendrothele bispora (strain CBS 962.96) TaxID=1314807 RepID=A0A4S8MDF4_DENBC|nr:hypothetical protein K435DRAFT_794425 [Dendrothele bispora CBS 962.96]
MSRSFYNNAINCTFNGKIFNVAGNLNFMDDSGSEDRIVSHGARGESIFDEYEYLSEVNEELCSPERLECTKTTYKIDLLGRCHKEATSTLPYRIAIWEQDFVKYSNQHPNFVHLYGFNGQKSSPSLIFCDNVIPFMQVWEHCSSIVKLHIHYSLRNAVFIRCDTGEICFGSQGPSKKRPSDLECHPFLGGFSGITLPFSLYYDEAGLKKYLLGKMGEKNLPVLTPSLIRPSYSHSLNDLTSTEVIPLPSVLWQGHDGLRQKLIGTFKNLDQSYSYTLEPWICGYNYVENGTLLGTGWTRFHYESYIGKKFRFHVNCSHEATQRICNAWFYQKQYYLNVVNKDALGRFGKQISFLEKDWCPESGSTEYAAAKYLQEIQGFDPLTQDFARTHGLPLIEILSPSKHFHPNVVNLTEEDQEELYTWYDAEETLSDKSDPESVYEEASSQIQTTPFPTHSAEQELNWTTP